MRRKIPGSQLSGGLRAVRTVPQAEKRAMHVQSQVTVADVTWADRVKGHAGANAGDPDREIRETTLNSMSSLIQEGAWKARRNSWGIPYIPC